MKKKKPRTQTAIRIDDPMLIRADKLAEHESQRGKRCTRSDILRMALFEGFAVLENEQRKAQ